MTLNIQLRSDNEAFSPDAAPEVARILRELADKFDNEATNSGRVFRVLDVNGNEVGHAIYNVTPEYVPYVSR